VYWRKLEPAPGLATIDTWITRPGEDIVVEMPIVKIPASQRADLIGILYQPIAIRRSNPAGIVSDERMSE
jgi:hypothetical protein